jgi:hypothetical protein
MIIHLNAIENSRVKSRKRNREEEGEKNCSSPEQMNQGSGNPARQLQDFSHFCA